MCGIAGIYSLTIDDSSRIKRAVVKMVNGLSYRGPDDQNSKLIGERVCIGNARLSIVDVSKGTQPMSVSKNLHIVFNGEIYNHKEIRHKYLSSQKFSTDSDTLHSHFNRNT